MASITTPPRSDVPVERTWDAASVFATVEEWEAELEAVVADLRDVAAFTGRLAEGASVTIEALAARDDLTPSSGPCPRLRRPRLRRRDDGSGRGRALRPSAGCGLPGRGGGRLRRARAARARDAIGSASGRRTTPRWRPTPITSTISSGEESTCARPRSRSCSGCSPTHIPGAYTVYSGLVDSDLDVRARDRSSRVTRSRSRRARSTACSAARTGSLRRSAWESYADGYRELPQHARRELCDSDQAGRLLGAGAPSRVHARSGAVPLEHPARRVRQPARDVRAEPADLAPVLAGAGGPARRRLVAAVRPLGAARRRPARARRTSSASSGSASRSRRSATSTSTRFVAAVSRSAGSTSIRTRARWAVRSRPARRARTRSS